MALGLERPSPKNGPTSNESHVPPRGSAFGLPEGEYEWKLGHHPNEHPALDTDTLMEAPARGHSEPETEATLPTRTSDLPTGFRVV